MRGENIWRELASEFSLTLVYDIVIPALTFMINNGQTGVRCHKEKGYPKKKGVKT
jgi:hypothetical protein